MTILNIRHHAYLNQSIYWEKYRYTMAGGKDFVSKYLERYSELESNTDYNRRCAISYCPAHAKSAITEVKNSVFERMSDISRIGGPKSYQECVNGENYGVDYAGNSMNSFNGRFILPELLAIGKVAIFVDKDQMQENETLLDSKEKRPYLYWFKAENILSWHHDDHGVLDNILLKKENDKCDPITELVTSTDETYLHLQLSPDGVIYEEFSSTGTLVNDGILNLTRLPVVILELSDSLLADVADYQIALLNIASSDLTYILQSNFPFYTEQTNQLSDFGNTGTQIVDGVIKPTQEIQVGAAKGRKYPKGVERPGFINPSSEPLKVSMEKQEQLKAEIRQLINMALTNLRPTRASADSKTKDSEGLESGLAYIGMELEYAERQIAEIWAEYERDGEAAIVNYPDKYSMRSDEDRRLEAKELNELIPSIPSITYQREIAKRIVSVTLGHKLSAEILAQINKELDSAELIAVDPETLRLDMEGGLVDPETASKARLYPKGSVEKAAKYHAERAARIVMAQTAAKGTVQSTVPQAGTQEATQQKTNSQDPATSVNAESGTRGKA